MTATISVVYVNFHCEDLIARSIRSLLETPPKETFEILVVDNGAEKDASFWDALPVKLLSSSGNVGFGAACNHGAAATQSEFLLFLNPDTVPSPGLLETLAGHLRNHPESPACGPALIGQDGTPQIYWNFHHLLSWELAEALYLQGPWRQIYGRKIIKRHGPNTAWPVAFVSGACLFVRRRAFEKAGGFDSRFFMNFEDFELCRRLEDQGPIHYLPWLKLIHEEGSTQQRNWTNFVFMRLDAHRTYIEIAYRGCRRMAAKAILLFAILLRLAIGWATLRGLARTRIPGYRKALACMFTGKR